MIIETLEQLLSSKHLFSQRSPEPLPSRILMVDPEFFEVTYAINPFMKDPSGALKKVDRTRAKEQWKKLKEKYESLGVKVSVIKGAEGFQDMVFAANQSLPFWDPKSSGPAVFMSQMRSDFRKGEVKFFEEWYRRQGYKIYQSKDPQLCFEGNGDILLHPGLSIIWGGCGPRTDKKVFQELSDLTGRDVIVLPLIHPSFYHLDTCFSILNQDTVVVQSNAFPPEALSMIKKVFKNVIETSEEECANYFTGNCHGINGRDVILHHCSSFETRLKAVGFNPHPVDTSEFMKSGGSVFCMKMMCY